MAVLSERLKHETRAEHEAIESSLSVLMSPQLTRERYALIVSRFYGFFADWEPRAAAVLPPGILHEMFADRLRTPHLRDDLLFLDCDDMDGLERCTGNASVPTRQLAEVLGTMYVTEGSTLGGQAIARHLETHLNLRDCRGYSYFYGAGRNTMPRWRDFKTTLDAAVPAEDEEIAIRSAAETFTKLRLWLSSRS
jgi:heme oxygenase